MDIPDEMTVDEYMKFMKSQSCAPTRHRRRKQRIDWVKVLCIHIAAEELPDPQAEHRFHPTRQWRFDLAWPQHKVACEIEGGTWMRTNDGRSKGHANPIRFAQDCEKYNEAALSGWLLVRVTPSMIDDGRAVAWLCRALRED